MFYENEKSFQRYEKKYLTDRSRMKEIVRVLKRHMKADAHDRESMGYKVCNLYLDTAKGDVFEEALLKPWYREKIRLRSYGYVKGSEDHVFLEMKKKVGGFVSKRRVRLTAGEAEAFLSRRQEPQDASFMTRQILGEAAYSLQVRKAIPACRISYDRVAFVTDESDFVRVTLDTNLRSSAAEGGIRVRPREELFMPADFCVMEVKTSGACPLWLSDLLKEEGLLPQSFSKFVTAGKKERGYDYNAISGAVIKP
ncbi:MAG: polyphosphate polymerase domain-containing protein [Eubacterium sp.]|nr:polyphosphate polymerase domain-containing protein [Eubacterium sp.]